MQTVFFQPSLDMWVVTRYEDVTAALKDHERFSSALCYDTETAFNFLEITPEARAIIDSVIPSTTLQMAGADQPDHARLRNSVSKAFRPRRIEQLEVRVQRISDRLVDRFVNDGQVDLVEQFTYPLPVLSILSLIGIPEQDTEQIKSWCADWTALMFNKLPPDQQITCAYSLRAFHQYLIDLIALRRKEPQEDLTSDVVQAIDAGETELSLAETVNLLCHLIGAGHETTVNQLNTCLYHLLRNRSSWLKIQNNPEVIPDIAEEILRLDPALRGPLRVTTEAVTLDGVTIPKGARVYLLLASANRDKEKFSHPEAFDPARKDLHRHITFGYGIHHCLGAPLARLEIRIALHVLSQRLPGLRLVPDQELKYKQSAVVKSLTQLLVEWDKNEAHVYS